MACKVDVSCEALELASAQAKGFLLKWSAECLPLLRRSPALGHTHYRGGGDERSARSLGVLQSWGLVGLERVPELRGIAGFVRVSVDTDLAQRASLCSSAAQGHQVLHLVRYGLERFGARCSEVAV